MAMPKPGSQIARLGLVALFVLTWSSAFPAAKIAVHLAPIALFLGARFFVAGALLLCWAWSAGELRRGLPWFTLAWLGVLNQAGYQGLAWLGAARISAGLATIIASLSPITVACLAVPLLGERMSWRKAAGLLLGCAGAAWVVRDRVQVSGEDPIGVLLVFGALAAMTAGTLAFKRAAPVASLAVAVGGQQVAAGAFLLMLSAFTENPATVQTGPALVLTYLWVTVVVSIGALLLWFLLLKRGSASSASALHFLMPPVGLLMSWAVLGERLHPADLLGVMPIAAGIWLVTRPVAAPR
jgi:drug/metabolite transporter (DMT)-like permease